VYTCVSVVPISSGRADRMLSFPMCGARWSHLSHNVSTFDFIVAGEGFDCVAKFIKAAWPPIVILENVPGLIGDGEDEYIVDTMCKLGYWVRQLEHCARDYGSCCARHRYYWLAVKLPDDVVPSARCSGMWSMLHQSIMASMKIGAFPPIRFIADTEACRKETNEFLQDDEAFNPDGRAAKIMKVDSAYKEEHFVLFRSCGLEWPPLPSAIVNGFKIRLHGLISRQTEVLLFCHQRFPPADDDTPRMEFIDVNKSLGMLVNYKPDDPAAQLKSPWSDSPKTLVGSCSLIVRINTKDGTPSNSRVVRPIEGWEYMSMIGWSVSDWRAGGSMPPRSVLSNMSGNAFSGFAIGPLFVASLCLAGTVGALPVESMASSPDAEQSASEGESEGLCGVLP
jgi:site-specific DNA-cytosine methylase